MLSRRLVLLALVATLLFGVVPPAGAIAPVEANTKNKGLYLSPVRDYLTLKAGDTTTHVLTVANLTEAPMDITTHIEEFSVANFSYDFTFSDSPNGWVSFTDATVTLQPNESRNIPYRISVPDNAAPGGHYYTLFASSTSASGTAKSTVQATMLLYLTVDGKLVRTSQAVGESLPSFVISPEVNYSVDIKNTGNTHYFAYTSASISGPFYRDSPNGTSQLLMPGTTRKAAGSIKSPLIPGIYTLTYTVAPDQGEPITGSRIFVYLPLWFIILFGFSMLVSYLAYAKRVKRTPLK